MNSNLRTGDTVVVIAGKDKGKQGKIIASNAETHRVTVAGVNVVKKHRKPRSQTDKGGIKSEEAPIDVSNVLIVCPSCGKPTRIGHMLDSNGKKHRMCKKCNKTMDGEVRAKTVKQTKESAKTEVKETKETAKTSAKPAQKVQKAEKAPQKAKNTSVATKAKVDTNAVKRKTPQAKQAAK